MIKEELAEYINKWIELQNKSHEIIKYLFEHTELFEQRYMHEYKDELFRYFAGKITRNGTDLNKLNNLFTPDDREQLQKQKLRRY